MLEFYGVTIWVRGLSQAVLSTFIGHSPLNFASFGQVGLLCKMTPCTGSICGWFY